jgi:hypothetical protein
MRNKARRKRGVGWGWGEGGGGGVHTFISLVKYTLSIFLFSVVSALSLKMFYAYTETTLNKNY